MSARASLDVLVVRADGRRLLCLRVDPRRLCMALALLLAIGAGGGAVLARSWRTPAAAAAVPPPPSPVEERQRALLDVVRHRLGEIQTEVSGWHEAQASLRRVLRARSAAPAEPLELAGESGSQPLLASQVDHLLATVQAETRSLRGLEPLVTQAVRTLATLPLRWPVRAAVSSEFGERPSPWAGSPEFHGGIDIAAHAGTRVVAPSSGRVAFVGATPEYGNTVVLDHGNAIHTRFGHLERVIVKRGQKVERGQAVALSGNTGRSTGPHLHYEVIVQGRRVNPRPYLRE
jgi:murein DD-endopeptidase MepM/ murein hydrolase activator NlpD